MIDITTAQGIAIFGILYFATHTLQLVVQLIANWLRDRRAKKAQEEAQKRDKQQQFQKNIKGRR